MCLESVTSYFKSVHLTIIGSNFALNCGIRWSWILSISLKLLWPLLKQMFAYCYSKYVEEWTDDKNAWFSFNWVGSWGVSILIFE